MTISPKLKLSNSNLYQSNDDGSVQFVGDAPDDELNSFVRTIDCLPEIFASYQFDVEIINSGDDDSISIGLASKTSDKSPGMNPNTIGIYSFDGSICRNGEEVLSCLPFTTGDVVSCNVHKNKIASSQFAITSCQFSKNGELMGTSLNVGGKEFFPSVGLHSPGAKVQIRLNITRKSTVPASKEILKDLSKRKNNI